MRKTLAFVCTAFCLFLLAVPQSKADTCGVAGNLVQNCGFETGDFSSWAVTGSPLNGIEGFDIGDGINPLTGADQADFYGLTTSPTTISQTIGTNTGDTYTISFYLAQDTAVSTGYPNEFSALFGGVGIDDKQVVVEGYTKYMFSEVASSSSSVLALTFGNDGGEFLLDDVSVVDTTPVGIAATPEPSAWVFMLTAMMGAAFLWKRGYFDKGLAGNARG
jgi:hypothetical protein